MALGSICNMMASIVDIQQHTALVMGVFSNGGNGRALRPEKPAIASSPPKATCDHFAPWVFGMQLCCTAYFLVSSPKTCLSTYQWLQLDSDKAGLSCVEEVQRRGIKHHPALLPRSGRAQKPRPMRGTHARFLADTVHSFHDYLFGSQ